LADTSSSGSPIYAVGSKAKWTAEIGSGKSHRKQLTVAAVGSAVDVGGAPVVFSDGEVQDGVHLL
jgi:hypothetical protein